MGSSCQFKFPDLLTFSGSSAILLQAPNVWCFVIARHQNGALVMIVYGKNPFRTLLSYFHCVHQIKFRLLSSSCLQNRLRIDIVTGLVSFDIYYSCAILFSVNTRLVR